MVTSRGRRSTADLSSPGAPALHTHTPLIATLSWSGSNAALVVPTAASTRPQFGSSPWIAHLSRLQRAIARPTSTASGSLAAPVTSIVIALLAPSASACIWVARSRAGRRQQRGELGRVGRAAARAAGQQQHRVVGGHAAVGVQPVEGRPDRVAQRVVQGRRRQVGVGGQHHQHRGERRGEHRRALRHAADLVAGAADGAGLRHRVGGPDRVRRGQPAVGCGLRGRGGRRRPAACPAAAARRSGRSSRPRPRRRRCRAGRPGARRSGGCPGSQPGRCTRWRRRSSARPRGPRRRPGPAGSTARARP